MVGVARSGTTLIRTILERSGQVAIARETHFVGHVQGRRSMRHELRRLGDLRDDATIRRFVDDIYTGALARRVGQQPYLTWLVKAVDRKTLEGRFLAAERSERGVFQAMLEVYAEGKGRPRWGEKTPAHVRHVETLMEWFPDARVVHMVRDPRAVFVSELRRRQSHGVRAGYRALMRVPLAYPLYVLVKTTILWAEAADRDAMYARRFPDRYRRQRFEDLVTEPEAQLEELFGFLDLALTPDALQTRVVSVGFMHREAGFDAGAATRWRAHISAGAGRWLTALLGSRMRQMGYPA